MSMYNHADGAVQFPATRVYNSPGQGCTTTATYSSVEFYSFIKKGARDNGSKCLKENLLSVSEMIIDFLQMILGQ